MLTKKKNNKIVTNIYGWQTKLYKVPLRLKFYRKAVGLCCWASSLKFEVNLKCYLDKDGNLNFTPE